MKCPKCSKDLPPDSLFCNYCGAKTSRHRSHKVPTAILYPEKPVAGAHGLPERYDIRERLGRGGMGEVFRAFDRRLNIPVAVKVLNGAGRQSEEGIARFLREARAIASLNHANIIHIYDVGEGPQGPYIVMEFVDGESLADCLDREGRLPPDQALHLVREVGRGLAYAHKRGVIHRDVKPDNILLTADGVPKLVDFGLARVPTEAALTREGAFMGTMTYAAPEQKFDAARVDPRADIYSLGAVLYELLTGEPPVTFRETSLPDGLAPVVLRAVEFHPDDRYPSIEALLDDLERARRCDGPRAAVDAVTVPLCPNCGRRNLDEAHFCEWCGVGLLDACPNCGGEYRAGTRFCPYCGTNIRHFAQVQDLLFKVRAAVRESQYAKALRLARQALELDPKHLEAARIVERCQKQVEALREHIGRARGFLARQEYERAEPHLEEILRLNPGDRNAAAMVASLPRRIRERDFDRSLRRAGEALKEERYGDALEAARHALSLRGDSVRAQRIRDVAAGRLQRENARKVQTLLAQARDGLKHHDYSVTMHACDLALEIDPDNANALLLLQRAVEKKYAQAPTAGSGEAEAHEPKALAGMVYIPPGSYPIGMPGPGFWARSVGRRWVDRRRRVYVPAFYMDIHPVTNAQYARFVEEGRHPPPRHWRDGRIPKGLEHHPVVNVSFYDAFEYAVWAGKRLPHVEEWERAAMGEEGRVYPWGSRMDRARGNFLGSGTTSVHAHPQGATPEGVMDLLGNVWEWCDDHYHVAGTVTRPIRGCCWTSELPSNYNRTRIVARLGRPDVGFRCVVSATRAESRRARN